MTTATNLNRTQAPILITGATGNIGRPLVAALVAAGANVIAGSRSGESVAGAPGRKVDMADPAQLQQAFAGVERVFLLFPFSANAASLAANAVAAAKAAGVKHLVRSSGAGADPQSPVAIGKMQGEIDQLVMDSGIPYSLLLPNSFMQNWSNLYAGMIQTGAVYLSHGEGKISAVDVRDIADVAAAILLNPDAHAGKSYNLTGPEALSAAESIAIINQVSQRAVAHVAIPESAAVEAMKNLGVDDWTVAMLSSLNQIIAQGYAAAVSDDVSTITGKPGRTFAAFAKEHVASWAAASKA